MDRSPVKYLLHAAPLLLLRDNCSIFPHSYLVFIHQPHGAGVHFFFCLNNILTVIARFVEKGEKAFVTTYCHTWAKITNKIIYLSI